MANANFCLVLPLGLHRHRVNPRGEFAVFRELGVRRHLGKLRIHVLHAGDAQRCGMFQRPASSAQSLLVRHRRNRLLDQVLRRVLENAGGISARVAHDYSARNIGSLRVNAGQLHGC